MLESFSWERSLAARANFSEGNFCANPISRISIQSLEVEAGTLPLDLGLNSASCFISGPHGCAGTS